MLPASHCLPNFLPDGHPNGLPNGLPNGRSTASSIGASSGSPVAVPRADLPRAPGRWAAGATRLLLSAALALAAGLTAPVAAQTPAAAAVAAASPTAPVLGPLRSIERLELQRYLGTWYQVAWFPNRFQRQCVSDTAAQYSLRDDGRLAVLNQCRDAQGALDSAAGVARPTGRVLGSTLEPAQLEVSFLPAFLRWTGIGWGRYWVIDLPEDYRYAVVSEPSREFLWVLSRTPQLAPGDRERIRERVKALGFDLERWADHPHTGSSPAPR